MEIGVKSLMTTYPYTH